MIPIDNKTRIHIELTKNPGSVEEAVHEVSNHISWDYKLSITIYWPI